MTKDEQEIDADRLARAAPDLLAALKGLGAALRDWDGASTDGLWEAALAARAAIAKAEGKD